MPPALSGAAGLRPRGRREILRGGRLTGIGRRDLTWPGADPGADLGALYTVDDDLVARAYAGAHHAQSVDERAERNFPLLDDAACADNENDFVALLGRHGVVRDEQTVIGSRAEEPQMAEHARRQRVIGIGNHGATADRARIGVERIVDEVHLALDDVAGLVLQSYLDGIGVIARLGAGPHAGFAFIFQVERLGAVEGEPDGVEIGDIGQDRRVLYDQIARRHAPVRCPAIERSGDTREFEVQCRAADGGLSCQKVSRGLLFRGKPGFVFLFGDHAVCEQVTGAGQLDACIRHTRRRMRLLPARLIQCRLIGSRIDDEEHLALPDNLSVTKSDRLQIA